MDYSIYKDDKVSSTIEKIQKILSSIGIILEEYTCDFPTDENQISDDSKSSNNRRFFPYSCRISFPQKCEIGSNGKGTTKENARASAYAEFMERLQNQSLQQEFLMLCSDKFSFAPDEKKIDKDVEKFLLKHKYLKIFSYCQRDEIFGIPFNNVCVPFYNIKGEKLEYLPPLHFVFSTNGMASGNTPEEALVQGFSEICERYSFKQVFLNNISMPDIPKKYYEQYERIKGLIDYTEQLGWKVTVKDASLGLGLPVICTIFEHKGKGVFSFKFGSQPSLPIAIERTITEFFQGALPNNPPNVTKNIYKIADYSKKGFEHILLTLNSKTWFFGISDKIHSMFFKKNPDYKFSDSTWIDKNKKYTNKELLKFLIDRITAVTDNEILVRDASFLGFPSYHIFIPKFSEIEYYDNAKLNLYYWTNYPHKKINAPYNIDSLISATLFNLKYRLENSELVPHIPDEYLLILCYILKDDIKNVLKYCEAFTNRQNLDGVKDFISNNQNLINLIFQYFKLKQQKETPAIINNIINNLYDKNVINKFKNLLNNLDFAFITNLIAEEKEKDKERMQMNRNKSKEELDYENKTASIKKKLIQKYIENTPNQMELAKVFDFSGIKSI